jgi:hypothetical protein
MMGSQKYVLDLGPVNHVVTWLQLNNGQSLIWQVISRVPRDFLLQVQTSPDTSTKELDMSRDFVNLACSYDALV